MIPIHHFSHMDLLPPGFLVMFTRSGHLLNCSLCSLPHAAIDPKYVPRGHTVLDASEMERGGKAGDYTEKLCTRHSFSVSLLSLFLRERENVCKDGMK